MTTVALIPARGGSKGVPRKNLRVLGGRPLIAWTIDCALACRGIDRVVVTTEDDEIASVSTSFGADVPFRRPAELAVDAVGDLPVYAHALEQLAAEDCRPDVVVWLRPTAPLRAPADVTAALDLLERSGAGTVRSVCPAAHHPFWMKRLDEDGRLSPFTGEGDEWTYPRRQDLPPAYRLNGAIDAVRCATVPADGPLFGRDARGFVMPEERSIDIDTELDLAIAEALLERSRP